MTFVEAHNIALSKGYRIEQSDPQTYHLVRIEDGKAVTADDGTTFFRSFEEVVRRIISL